MDIRTINLCIFLIIAALYVSAEDVLSNTNNNNDQPELQDNTDLTKAMDKRVPHPSWRSNVRIQHFQGGEMPPMRRFMSFNGPQRFYRYARRPFSLDFYDW